MLQGSECDLAERKEAERVEMQKSALSQEALDVICTESYHVWRYLNGMN